jgi:hypothetical protein
MLYNLGQKYTPSFQIKALELPVAATASIATEPISLWIFTFNIVK